MKNWLRNFLAQHRCRWKLVAVVGVLSTLGVWAFLRWQRPADPLATTEPGIPDPRLEFAATIPNVHPEVAYVGSERCAACHIAESESYRHHPMGKSLAPISDFPKIESFTGPLAFEAMGFHYDIRIEQGKLLHREKKLDAFGKAILEHEEEVQFALGSGTRGRSYLINRNGSLFQSPISWYTQKGIWDLAPSYRETHYHFERAIRKECLFCHADQVDAVPQTINRYQDPVFRGYAIGCERCHGPGELHVRRQEQGERYTGPDQTIVQPGRLAPSLRDSVCEQCHLQGEARVTRQDRDWFDFRPGMSLDLFQSVFVLAPEFSEFRAVGHVEQMHASVCRQKSGGKLGCISCHDPHQVPQAEHKAEYFRDRCQRCHADPKQPERGKGCSESKELRALQGENCVACHMPRRLSADIIHTSVTDHRVLRRPELQAGDKKPPNLVRGQVPLRRFHKPPLAPRDVTEDRDLGIALRQLGSKQRLRKIGDLVLPLLQAHLVEWPNDADALETKAVALGLGGNESEALKIVEQVLKRSPRRESVLATAAILSALLKRHQEAVDYWQRTIDVNPAFSDYHVALATEFAHLKNWPMALESVRRGLHLNPTRLDGRKLIIQCLVQQGNRQQAEQEFAVYSALGASDTEEVRIRWLRAAK